MKTKIKRHSRSVISVILAVCMLVSCMTVGIIATDAAKVQNEKVGAVAVTAKTIYFCPDAIQSWDEMTGTYSSSDSITLCSKPDKNGEWDDNDLAGDTMIDTEKTYNGNEVFYGNYYVQSSDSKFNYILFVVFDSNGDYKGKLKVEASNGWGNDDWSNQLYDGAWHASWSYDAPPLTKPIIAFDSAINTGDTALLRVSNHADIADDGASPFSYVLKRGQTTLTEGAEGDYTYSDGVFTIPNAQAGSYTVQATTSASGFANSAVSEPATLTVYEPEYALLGDVSSEFIYDIINQNDNTGIVDDHSNAHASDKAEGWPADGDDDDDHFKDSVKVNAATAVNGTVAPGVYRILFKTTNTTRKIDISLWKKGVGQVTFNVDGNNLAPQVDYYVPSSGKDGIGIVTDGTAGSLVFKPNVSYTITINQTDNTMKVESNCADVNAVAKVKSFDPSSGDYNPSLANAVHAVGTAVAAPSTVVVPTNSSTLTATVNDNDKYTFNGWYTNAECTGTPANVNEEFTLQNVTTDQTYYALFVEKIPEALEVTEVVSNGTVSCTGGKAVPGEPTKAYKGATLTYTVAPEENYELTGVASTSGTVTVNGNFVTVKNITTAPTITFTITEVPTYTVTVVADNSTYGTVTVDEYTRQNGSKVQNTPGVTNTPSTTGVTNTTYTIKQGTTVQLTAVAASGGIFNYWSVTGSYSRSKNTPLTGKTISIKPEGNITVTANFVQGVSPAGTAVNSNYFIKTSSKKDDSNYKYNKNVPLYVTYDVQDGNDYYSEFRSYFLIGDTDDPANGLLKAGQDYWFILSDAAGDKVISDSHYNADIELTKSPNDNTWYNQFSKGENSGKYAVFVNFKSTAKTATVFWGKVKKDTHWDGYFDKTVSGTKYPVNFTVTTGGGGAAVDDTPSHEDYSDLYVLDGIDTNGDFGTNSFGNSQIVSANSGVLKYSYYDATGADQMVSTDAAEGALKYYYDPNDNLDFRVQTTIAANHQAIGVRAFVMNGMTYPATKARKANEGDPDVYYADITLNAGSGQGTLEVVPVYYNTLLDTDPKGYIKFYVDANSIGDRWGKTIGYSVWYSKDKDTTHGMEGGYPGQPLMSDGNQLYGYIPRYYVGVNADTLPADNAKNKFAGVLLTNLAEHNETHQAVLQAWEVSDYNKNYQTFDYEDPYEISAILDANNNDKYDIIKFVTKYGEGTTHYSAYESDFESNGTASIYQKDNVNWPSTIVATEPDDASVNDYATYAATNGFELLTDIDGYPVNIYNQKFDGGLSRDDTKPLFVFSVGNQDLGANEWDTHWAVFDKDGNNVKNLTVNPAAFIKGQDKNGNALNTYTTSPVYVKYEQKLAGQDKKDNSGTRIDGRWLYASTKDATTLRLRVAKVVDEATGELQFLEEGISWAEISDGTNIGALEQADASNLTKLLTLPNRTTEVTAKINPVGYSTVGMYMLKSGKSFNTNNGFSLDRDDYDNLGVEDTATSFTNATDNRMVIIVKEIPATDIVITHQMYGGPGAHKIRGFYNLKAELVDSSGTVVETFKNDASTEYTNKPITIQNLAPGNAGNNENALAPKGEGFKLKIYINTVMSGQSTFNQWYENDHHFGYNLLDSDEAHGSKTPVTYIKEIDVDTLYGSLDDNLSIKNLDYYSDLQSSDNVSIYHNLLPTTQEGLSGSTYVDVTVVNSSGATIANGALGTKLRTAEVSADFITETYADNGYQLKVQIWTVPTAPAEFDKFFVDRTTEMTTGTDSDNHISYTIGGSKTFNGAEYTAATVMIPVSYFFKEMTVEDPDNPESTIQIKVFDDSKKNFYTYSSLKLEYTYSMTYSFTSYRNLYSTQRYKVEGNFNLDDFSEYLEYKDYSDFVQCVTDYQSGSSGIQKGGYVFKDDNARAAFLNHYGPYENNFMTKMTWNTGLRSASNTTGVSVAYNPETNHYIIDVNAVDNKNNYVDLKFKLPYAHSDKDSGFVPVKNQNNEVVYVAVPYEENIDNLDYMSWWVYAGDKHYGTDNPPQFVTAPATVVRTNNGTPETLYFRYWSVKTIPGEKETSVEYTKCYSREFNLTIYQSSIAEPIYTALTQEEINSNYIPSPYAEAKKNDNVNGATITFIENSRNQYNQYNVESSQTTTPLPASRQDRGDRIFTDFLLSFANKDDTQYRTYAAGTYTAGLLIEQAWELDKDQEEKYYTKSASEYAAEAATKGAVNEAALKAKIDDPGIHSDGVKATHGYSYQWTEFDATQLDNKNRIEYYYSMAVRNHTEDFADNGAKNYVYRAYSYIKDYDTGEVKLFSQPLYFTIYDMASIENAADGMIADGYTQAYP